MVAVIREFDQQDWFGYCGCECWDGNVQPVVMETESWQVVVDKNGVEAVDLEGTAFHLNLSFPTQVSAKAFLVGLSEAQNFNPIDYGFGLV